MRLHPLPMAVEFLFIPCLLGFMIFLPFSHAQGPMNIQELEHILGAKGNLQEGVWVASLPRSDLKVAIEGVPVPPRLRAGILDRLEGNRARHDGHGRFGLAGDGN